MTIEQALSKYKTNKTGIQEVLDQGHLDYELRTDFKKLAPQFNFIKYMFYYFDHIVNVGLGYNSAIAFFAHYNINTLEDFFNYEKALKTVDIGKIVNDVANTPPVINKIFDILTIKDMQERFKAIPKQYLEDNVKVHYRDSKYQLLDLETLKTLLKWSRVNILPYHNESRDCDDYAAMFKCDLSKIDLGNATVAKIEINLYGKDWGLFGAHAINLAYVDNDIKLIEPQNDGIMDIGDVIVGTKYYKIRRIEF